MDPIYVMRNFYWMKRQKKKSLFVRVMSTYGNFDKGFDAGPCFLFLYFPQGVKKGFFFISPRYPTGDFGYT